MTSENPVLYSYFRSSASWRVRIALAYKGINYDYKGVNLLKGEQKEDAYKKLNPAGKVPSLLIDGALLTESIPILEYLEETHPEKRLLPGNSLERAKVRKLAELINSGIQPIQNLGVLRKIKEVTGSEDEGPKWAKFWLTEGLKVLELELKKTAGTYCFGEEITLADVCLVPQLYNAYRFGVDMSLFPTIIKIKDELVQHPAFISAAPEKQPDCPEELKSSS